MIFNSIALIHPARTGLAPPHTAHIGVAASSASARPVPAIQGGGSAARTAAPIDAQPLRQRKIVAPSAVAPVAPKTQVGPGGSKYAGARGASSKVSVRSTVSTDGSAAKAAHASNAGDASKAAPERAPRSVPEPAPEPAPETAVPPPRAAIPAARCLSCGNQMMADAKFCPHCGTSRCVKCITLEPGGVIIFNSIALIHPARTGLAMDRSRTHGFGLAPRQ